MRADRPPPPVRFPLLGRFAHLSSIDVAKLSACFRQGVIAFFLERKLPVAGAIELLHDGAIVTVDGYLGIVTVGAPEFDLKFADVAGNTVSRKSRKGV